MRGLLFWDGGNQGSGSCFGGLGFRMQILFLEGGVGGFRV